jgi:O-methyltransferase involved in polyketide biosynthesis
MDRVMCNDLKGVATMTEKIMQSLEGVSETLLMTLFARARESQRADGMIKDEKAIAMVNKLAGDFSRLKMHRHDEIAVIMRMRKFDNHVRDFLVRNPDGIVVHIGCGLDTRFDRVDNGHVEWFDLDMPQVIELRRQLIEETSDRHHILSTSVFETGWMDELVQYRPRPFMFVAEGVFPYFEEIQVSTLFQNLRDRFPACEVVCDAHTPFVIWVDNLQLAYAGVKARLHWSIRNGKDPECWGKGITMLEEWNYYDDDELSLKAFRWVRMFPGLAKSSGVFHYRLGASS